ncbi:hypothetical protein CK203_012257 [Vitis vinifera]|uniref:Uncharacterized protein n=1 Tax=Vitis vinifera TaxID=29760 RepID=A0A438JKZ6_VITVI|nr:hypothetical protein CK203_074425 [Vitis vinifera]RVX09612.1 hypothetical protein CK203_012257 [Vitis vinifera]
MGFREGLFGGATETMAADSKPPNNSRCHHCAGPLSKDMETSAWTVPPFIRDSFSMIGTAVGGIASAFYGFNYVMPIVQKRVKGPMWLHFLVGENTHMVSSCKTAEGIHAVSGTTKDAPPVIVFSSTCAGLAGGAVPAVAQLASSSYHAVVMSRRLPPPSSQDDKMHKTGTAL